MQNQHLFYLYTECPLLAHSEPYKRTHAQLKRPLINQKAHKILA